MKAAYGSALRTARLCAALYEWDSYEWAFTSTRVITTRTEWTKSEVTFVSLHKTMYVHPLAYIDAEQCEGWVDDAVVEKIAARTDPSPAQKRLLLRWHVRNGHLDRVVDGGLGRELEGMHPEW